MTVRKILDTITDTELTVNEVTRKELLDLVRDYQESIRFSEELYAMKSPYATDPDLYIFIEYTDGSTYCRSLGEEEGRFKKINIKYADLNDGYEYYIYGKYVMNEDTNFIPQVVYDD